MPATSYSDPMNRPVVRFLITSAKFVLPVLILAYLLGWRIGREAWDALGEQPKNYSLLGVAMAVAMGALSLSFARWCLLVRAQGIELSMLEAFRLGSICYLLSFVSVGSVGGDLFKAVFLARRRPGRRIEAVASVLVDRGCGLYGLLLLVAITFLAADVNPHVAAGEGGESAGEGGADLAILKVAVAVLIAVGTGVVGMLVLGGRGVDRVMGRASKLRWVGGIFGRLAGPLRMFHEHPVAFVVAVAMSVGVQAMLAISIYLVARGLYGSPPTLAEHFVIVPIAMIASALPISPAGLGVLEAATESLYQLIPAEPTAASGTLVALVFEIVRFAIAGIGTLLYWTAPAEVRTSLREASGQEL